MGSAGRGRGRKQGKAKAPGPGHSPAGRSGWMGRHRRARSLSSTSQLFLPISKMPRSRTCSAAASGCCRAAHNAEGAAAAAGGASSSPPPSRALTRPPRLPRGMAEPQPGPEPGGLWRPLEEEDVEAAAVTALVATSAATATARTAETQEGGGAGRRGRQTQPSTLARQLLLLATHGKMTPVLGEKLFPPPSLLCSVEFSALHYPQLNTPTLLKRRLA